MSDLDRVRRKTVEILKDTINKILEGEKVKVHQEKFIEMAFTHNKSEDVRVRRTLVTIEEIIEDLV